MLENGDSRGGWIDPLFSAPELCKVDPSFSAGRSDFTLPGVPRRTMNADVGYDIPLPRGRSLELDSAGVYVGHSYPFFGPQGSAEMGHYIDGRLQATLHAGLLDLALLVTNPANNRSNTFAFGNPFTLSRGPQATPLPGDG